jgi:hypothetical protein
MNKHKQASRNPLLYWWNEFLFARYFEYETDLSPEQLADNLNGLVHSRQGWIWGLEKTAKITMHPNNKGLDFDVQSRRRRLFDPFGITTARTLGTAQVDSGTGQMRVQGDVKLGRFFHIFLLVYVMMIAGVYVPLLFNNAIAVTGAAVIGMTMPMLVLAVVFGLLWWRIYRDRNELADLIEAAVYDEKLKHSAGRLIASEDAAGDWQRDENGRQSAKKRG